VWQASDKGHQPRPCELHALDASVRATSRQGKAVAVNFMSRAVQHAPILVEVFPQAVRNGIEQAIDDNALKGAESWQIQSIGPLQADILDLQRSQTLFRVPVQGAVPLDRDHPLTQAGEQRREVAGAGPDLQDSHVGGQTRGLQQTSDGVRRVTDLPASNGQGNVAIGQAQVTRVQERRPRNRLERPQDGEVTNAALT
jgi:hypothetical protein